MLRFDGKKFDSRLDSLESHLQFLNLDRRPIWPPKRIFNSFWTTNKVIHEREKRMILECWRFEKIIVGV